MLTKEQLEWRRQGVGASDAPVIMGVSPWKNIHQLWEEKVYGTDSQQENWAMRRGNEIEPIALDWFMTTTGILMDSQVQAIHKEHDWMRATLDGWDEDTKTLLEIKSCRVLHEAVPDHYFPQLQHQMAVKNVKWAYYESHNGEDGKILKLERDDAYVKTMIEKEKEFWDMVVNKIEPAKPKPDPVYMGEDENWVELSRELLIEMAKSKETEEKIKFLKSQLILFANGKESYGAGIKMMKEDGRETVDHSAVYEQFNISKDVLEGFKKKGNPFFKFYLDKKTMTG